MTYITNHPSRFKYKLNDLSKSDMLVRALKRKNWQMIKELVRMKAITEI